MTNIAEPPSDDDYDFWDERQMSSLSRRASFATEQEARESLESLLAPWFSLRPEVDCLFESQWLRIDYVARPKMNVDFPYPEFGIEVKTGIYDGFRNYTGALKQAIDYTNCTIDGRRLGVVFLFPGISDIHDDIGGMARGANRLAGMFKAGIIVPERWDGSPAIPRFEMSGGRLWDAKRGAVANPPRKDRVGSTIRM